MLIRNSFFRTAKRLALGLTLAIGLVTSSSATSIRYDLDTVTFNTNSPGGPSTAVMTGFFVFNTVTETYEDLSITILNASFNESSITGQSGTVLRVNPQNQAIRFRLNFAPSLVGKPRVAAVTGTYNNPAVSGSVADGSTVVALIPLPVSGLLLATALGGLGLRAYRSAATAPDRGMRTVT